MEYIEYIADLDFRDPFFLLAGLLAAFVVYWLSGYRGKALRRRRAKLRTAAAQESNVWRRRELMARWSELGGAKESRRNLTRRLVRDQGQKARVGGRSRSSNPYGSGLWGKSRLWKLGWKAVDRNIRWIERHKR